jgi:hypothetical protein
MNKIVRSAGRARARRSSSRNSVVFDSTALMRTKRLRVSCAITSASVVLPQPGGP